MPTCLVKSESEEEEDRNGRQIERMTKEMQNTSFTKRFTNWMDLIYIIKHIF